jgi:hypothetical protein
MKDHLDNIQKAYTTLSDVFKMVAKFNLMKKEDTDIYMINNPEEKLLIEYISEKSKEISIKNKDIDKIVKTIEESNNPILLQKTPSIIS